jgi:hypothetical protein
MLNGDFRYYMHDGTTAFSFELEGRLSDAGVRELQQVWRTASSVINGRSLIVDLSHLTSIDAAGQHLLRGWHDRRAQFVAKSPEAKALIHSITGQSVDLIATAHHRTWLPVPRAAFWRGRS